MTIRSELETRIKNWAAAQSPALTVAYENVPYSKPADKTPFVECYIAPLETIDVTVDGTRQRNIGIFYVNVWTPDGKGSGQSDRIVSSLVAAFPIVPKTGSVSIEKTPSAKQPLYTDGWRVVQVSIKYRYEV